MKYEEPANPNRDELDAALTAGEPEAIVETMLGLVARDPDWRWLQETCLRLLGHEHSAVRANAVTALGHVARIHGALDKERVVDALTGLARVEPALAGRVDEALDDIAMFT